MNNAGGHVYLDQKNDYMVRVSEGREPMAPPQYAQVTDHGDHYMDAKGFKFLKTLRSNDMDSWGNLTTGFRAASKPPWAPQMNVLRANPVLGSRASPVSSAPPVFPSYTTIVFLHLEPWPWNICRKLQISI